MKTRTAGRRDNMREEEVAIWDALNIQVVMSQTFFFFMMLKEDVARLDV